MIEDPIVEEVRKFRNEYAKQFNYDLDAICRDLQQKQEQAGKNVVSFSPKRPKTVGGSARIGCREELTASIDTRPDSDRRT